MLARIQLDAVTAESSPHLLDAWVEAGRWMWRDGVPEMDDPGPVEMCADLISDPWDLRRAVVALSSYGDPLGGALVYVFPAEPDDPAEVELAVSPDARGRGVGRALLDAACELARSHGRTVVSGRPVEGSAGARFALATGAKVKHRTVRSLQRLPAPLVDAPVPDGYELSAYSGPFPAEFGERLAAVHEAMNDAPRGELSHGDVHWTVERLRSVGRRRELAGMRTHTVVAVHSATGEIAGFTELVVAAERPRCGHQWDTAVVATHRGHGLGLVLKAANLQRLTTLEPQLDRILTWNAEDNAHMRDVNTALGYRPVGVDLEVELTI